MNRRMWIVAALLAATWPLYAMADTPNVTDPKNLDTFTLVAVALGYAITWLTALVTKTHWSDFVKHGVFAGLAIVAAGISTAVTSDLDWHRWARALLIVFVSGLVSYKLNRGAVTALSARTD